MEVPDEVRKCVVFLHLDRGAGREAAGTAFFLGVPFPGDSQRVHRYLVTARHVIAGMRGQASDGKGHVRINLRDGGFAYLETRSLDITGWARRI
jgi:hypothetical protein